MKISSIFSKDLKTLILIFFFGLFIRLIALPFSRTNTFDPVERIDIAWRWLENPHIVTHGIWAPLHTYLIAGSMWLVEDPILPPILINILFSVATVIPLFLFTKKEFGEKESWFVACAFLLYPIAFRNSLMAFSDTPFAFFVALSLLFISISRKKHGSWKHALIAGLSMTLAAMLRYEGWILIPLMGVILWKKPKLMIVFLTSSIIFPVFWMIGNQIHNGDPLYSINFQHRYEVERIKGMVTYKEVIKRILFFPGAIFFGMTIFLSTLSIWGAVIALVEKKKNSIWLVPFAGLFIAFFYKSVSGSLGLTPRYSLVLGMFLLPFSIEVFNKIKQDKHRKLISFIVLISIFPLSYSSHLITGFIPSIARVLSIRNLEPTSFLESIPRLTNNTKIIYESINKKSPLINRSVIWVDFNTNLHATQSISLIYRINPEKKLILSTENGLLMKEESDELSAFLFRNNTGVILFEKNKNNKSTLNYINNAQNNFLEINNLQKSLLFEILIEHENFVMYRYKAIRVQPR